MSKNEGFSEAQLGLVNELIEKRLCPSKSMARRLVMCMPEEELRKRIDKRCLIKIERNEED